MLHWIAGALLLQAAHQNSTSPAGGDTTGYWQQRVEYTIIAHLDEGLHGITAQGRLKYVNNSPDTLREMFFHQYLNAFKPGSKWSASDTRENRERFQHLGEPNYGYERFTRAPVVDGIPTLVDYPGMPDSTVAHIRLPRPLAPGDSAIIEFRWEARPSVVPRRQARRGRTYDFAQWYPKVAVYDRGGWQPNPLVPAGELYGEFGTYDVTIVAHDDQVIGATGVAVSGDPGYARVSKTGPPAVPRMPSNVPESPVIVAPAGERVVRFLARNVHHFAWSASPEYIYEGGYYVTRDTTRHRYPTFDSVAVNVLYKEGDDTIWGGGRALSRTIDALRWLERIYGPYAYPQITNLHRLDGGGTEFPMVIMNGTASPGLILHELGHVYTYGILANNEWRSGWMDEGLTDYQSRWAQHIAPQDNQHGEIPRGLPRIGTGYRANVTPVPKADSTDIESLRVELLGRAQPVGTNSADFSEFGIYNRMIYDRASIMYGHLRDLMGDSVFTAFLHDYYERWALRHVDEAAMRASAERAYGKDLGWFFAQWVHGTGLLNYGLGEDTTVAGNGSEFITRVRLTKHGELRHAMPVGVHSAAGWTIVHANPLLDDQWVDVTTPAKPDSIALDPFHVTWDWDWRDNTREAWVGTIHAPDVVFDWPFLEQQNRARTIIAMAPRLWYSGPQGIMGGVGVRTNYFGLTDIHRGLLGVASRVPDGASQQTRIQLRAQADDVYLAPFMTRPLMGVGASAMYLDGIARGVVWKHWDLSPFIYANGPKIRVAASASGTYPTATPLLPEQWDDAHVTEFAGSARIDRPAMPDSSTLWLSIDAALGYASGRSASVSSRGYGRVLATAENVVPLVPGRELTIRVNAGLSPRAPLQRAIFASSKDPFETFTNNYVRPRAALFRQPDFTLVPLGGGQLRGYSPLVAFDRLLSGNVEIAQRFTTMRGDFGRLAIWGAAFGDGGVGSAPHLALADKAYGLVDAGAGLRVRGRLYDRDIDFRLDVPLVATDPFKPLAIGGLPNSIRWAISWR